MRIVTAAEMREIDRRTTAEAGIPSLQLMENAALQAATCIGRSFAAHRRQRIVILCGKGNNGGDGLALARLLLETGGGEKPQVILIADPASLRGDPAANLQRLRSAGLEPRAAASPSDWASARASLSTATLIVDALLGTGLKGPAEGLPAEVIADVNRLRGDTPVTALDIPSGLPSDGPHADGLAIQATRTITFAAPKRGLVLDANAQFVGELEVGGIGTPPDLIEKIGASNWRWIEPFEFRALPLRRRPDAHKGDFGHALIVAGSRGKTGAAALAGMGALRAGAGLVTIATPESVLPVVASFAPEYMTEPLAATDAGSISLRALDYGRFDALAAGKSVLALGPGLGQLPETQEFVRTVVRDCPLPLMLDADGLNAFAGRAGDLKLRATASLAITPHPGEMARLLGCKSDEVQQCRNEIAVECAARWNAHVVLKGHRTLIASPAGELWFNSTGCPAMATGGTGDVLTGLLAGLTAQFGVVDWPRVLALGASLHGTAGALAARGQQTIVASDLARCVPLAYKLLMAHLRDDFQLDIH
jgi:NAD(P)H-hydrate epimerase